MENNIIQWAVKSIVPSGIIIKNPPEEVERTPYSDVSRFLTSEGYIYLKKIPAALSLEPDIIRFLHDHGCHVPVLLDFSKELNCFLTKDAGISLRDYLKENGEMELLLDAVNHYISIQKMSVKYIDDLIDIGIPDWRLKYFPDLYNQLISKEDFLRRDSMTNEELDMLHELSPKLILMCDQLAKFNIPETLDHCDFHSNNILINDEKHLTIIDWGETVITNPLFSLITCMNAATHYHNMKETDQIYFKLQNTSLVWIEGERENILLEAISIARKLWPIYFALAYHRLMMSSDEEEFKVYYAGRPNRLAGFLRDFIKNSR